MQPLENRRPAVLCNLRSGGCVGRGMLSQSHAELLLEAQGKCICCCFNVLTAGFHFKLLKWQRASGIRWRFIVGRTGSGTWVRNIPCWREICCSMFVLKYIALAV